MSQRMPPEGSSVYLLADLETNGCRKIPAGTVGIVKEHCSTDEIQVAFTVCNTTVKAKVGTEQVKKKIFTVLSIDGGGIRGIIPALILDYIEQQMKDLLPKGTEKCQRRIANFFDLIAGTSTGGIIALALTKPEHMGRRAYTAADLVDLYMGEGENIFNRSAMHRIYSGDGLLNKKYPADGIEQVLEGYFGETKLSEATTRVLIPSYDMRGARNHWKNDFDCQRGGHPRFFKNYALNDSKQKVENSQQHAADCPSNGSNTPEQHFNDPLMRDVARATSAAPTYFEPLNLDLHLPSNLTVMETLVDGGIFANNPAMCAYADAKKMMINDGRPNDEILIVSLGTGNLTGTLNAAAAKNWGQLNWVRTLITMIFDGASDTVDYQLRQLIPSGNIYYRFQPQLTFGNDEMDDVSRENLLALKALTKTFIKRKRCKLNAISQRLVTDRPLNL